MLECKSFPQLTRVRLPSTRNRKKSDTVTLERNRAGVQNEDMEAAKMQKGGSQTSLCSPAFHQNEVGRPPRKPPAPSDCLLVILLSLIIKIMNT